MSDDSAACLPVFFDRSIDTTVLYSVEHQEAGRQADVGVPPTRSLIINSPLIIARRVSNNNQLLLLLAGLLVYWMALVVVTMSLHPPMTMALKVTAFRVPPIALQGSDVHLDCLFSSPSRTKLYSVKWYQNQDEFFRHIFADQTPSAAFSLPGIKVDVSLGLESSQFLFYFKCRLNGLSNELLRLQVITVRSNYEYDVYRSIPFFPIKL